MARIRTIKPEFWTSEQVVECSKDARLLFIGLWNFCDDAGIMPVKPKQILMKIFPADGESSENILRMIDELSANRLISVYSVDDQDYLKITGWEKHQKIDQPTYKFPHENGEVPESVRRTFADRSPPEGNGMEGNGRDKGQKKFTPPSVKDVAEYCSSRSNGVDAQKFVDHYAASGWMRGKNRIRDWKACVRTWEQRAASPKSETVENWI